MILMSRPLFDIPLYPTVYRVSLGGIKFAIHNLLPAAIYRMVASRG